MENNHTFTHTSLLFSTYICDIDKYCFSCYNYIYAMLWAFIIKQHQPRSVHFYERYANNLDPDQTPQNVASDQGVHFLFIQCFIQIFKIIIIIKNN